MDELLPTPPGSMTEAFKGVETLVSTFMKNEGRYLSPSYQEAEVRKDFIDKLFVALGWDVNHDVQTNPYEQEVKVEPAVGAGGQRRADYAFRLAPNYRDVRFFVERRSLMVNWPLRTLLPDHPVRLEHRNTTGCSNGLQ